MNDDNYSGDLHAWIEPEIEARVVALILGEASDFEAEELERLMEERPEIRVFKRRLESVHGLLGVTLGPGDDEEWRLSPEKRAHLLESLELAAPAEEAVAVHEPAGGHPAKEKRIRKAGRRVMWSAAACLTLTVVLFAFLSLSGTMGVKRAASESLNYDLDLSGGADSLSLHMMEGDFESKREAPGGRGESAVGYFDSQLSADNGTVVAGVAPVPDEPEEGRNYFLSAKPASRPEQTVRDRLATLSQTLATKGNNEDDKAGENSDPGERAPEAYRFSIGGKKAPEDSPATAVVDNEEEAGPAAVDGIVPEALVPPGVSAPAATKEAIALNENGDFSWGGADQGKQPSNPADRAADPFGETRGDAGGGGVGGGGGAVPQKPAGGRAPELAEVPVTGSLFRPESAPSPSPPPAVVTGPAPAPDASAPGGGPGDDGPPVAEEQIAKYSKAYRLDDRGGEVVTGESEELKKALADDDGLASDYGVVDGTRAKAPEVTRRGWAFENAPALGVPSEDDGIASGRLQPDTTTASENEEGEPSLRRFARGRGAGEGQGDGQGQGQREAQLGMKELGERNRSGGQWAEERASAEGVVEGKEFGLEILPAATPAPTAQPQSLGSQEAPEVQSREGEVFVTGVAGGIAEDADESDAARKVPAFGDTLTRARNDRFEIQRELKSEVETLRLEPEDSESGQAAVADQKPLDGGKTGGFAGQSFGRPAGGEASERQDLEYREKSDLQEGQQELPVAESEFAGLADGEEAPARRSRSRESFGKLAVENGKRKTAPESDLKSDEDHLWFDSAAHRAEEQKKRLGKDTGRGTDGREQRLLAELFETLEESEESAEAATLADGQAGARERTEFKLKNIVVPRVDLDDVTVEEAVDFLRQRSRELDHFELDPAKRDVAYEFNYSPPGDRDGDGGEGPGDYRKARISGLSLENVPLETALQSIAEKAQLDYSIDANGRVQLQPLTGTVSDPGSEIEIQTWDIPVTAWNRIQAGKATESTLNAKELLAVKDATQFQAPPREALERYGITFPEGATVTYVASSGKLIAKNTRANHGIIETLVENSLQQVEKEREALQHFEKSAAAEPYSTFSLHVSDVSFKLAKAALDRGEWPAADKIRVEEFVNAFDYGDPAPTQEEKVACQLEQAAHPFLQQRNLLRISMRTAALGRAAGTPLRLTVLLDNSGSMERADRVESVQNAFTLLASQLQPQDQVTLVSFARTPRLLADRVAGDQAAKLAEMVASVPSEGGTNLEEALRIGMAKAKEQLLEGGQNRVILLTDGAANLGNAKPEELSELVEGMRQQGIAFDACGVGAEGLNDEILESLTRKGDGRYYFLDRPEDADAGFAKQIAGALRPAARNVKVQVNFNPERVGHYKLYGFEKHILKKEDFRNDSVDAAELAAEEAGNAIYQVEVLPEGEGEIGTVSVRFQDMASGQMIEKLWTIPYDSGAPRLEEAPASLRLASGAAFLGEKLKGSMVGEAVDMNQLGKLMNSLPAAYPSNVRVSQLVEMTAKARELASE